MYSAKSEPTEQAKMGAGLPDSNSPNLADIEFASVRDLRLLSPKARYLAYLICNLTTGSASDGSVHLSEEQILAESAVGPIHCFNIACFREELVEAGFITRSGSGAAATAGLLEAYVLLGRDNFLVCGGDPYEVFKSFDPVQQRYAFRLGHQGYLEYANFSNEAVLYPVFAAKEGDRFIPTENLSLVLKRFLDEEEYPRKAIEDQNPFNLLLIYILASAKNSELSVSAIHSQLKEMGIELPENEFCLFMGPNRWTNSTGLSRTITDIESLYDRGAPRMTTGVVKGLSPGQRFRLLERDEIVYAKCCGVLDDILEIKRDEIEDLKKRLSCCIDPCDLGA